MKYISRVDAVIKEISEAANEARVEAAEEIGSVAQGNAPVLTGELRDSLRTEHEGNISRVGFTAPHSGFVEFGTSRQSAQPFLLPAVHGRGKKILKQKLEEKLKGGK